MNKSGYKHVIRDILLSFRKLPLFFTKLYLLLDFLCFDHYQEGEQSHGLFIIIKKVVFRELFELFENSFRSELIRNILFLSIN